MSRSPLMQIVISAMAIGLATSGCTSLGFAKNSDGAGSKAASANVKGDSKALALAEAAVAASPQDAALRAALGQQYMRVGRFSSAEASFAESMALQESPRTALNLALAKIANGRSADALGLIDKYREQLPASDYGLALALAGEPQRATMVLGDAARASDATARTRQNLAFSLALEGRWTEARVVAGQDMSYTAVTARLGQWASFMQARSQHNLVAGLLNTPVISDDPGMPVQLALNTNAADFVSRYAAVAAPTGYDPAPLAQYAPRPVTETNMAAMTAQPVVEVAPAPMPAMEEPVAAPAPVEPAAVAPAAAAPAAVADMAPAIAAPVQPYKVSVAIPPRAKTTARLSAPKKVTSQREAAQLVAKARKSSGLAVQVGAFSSMANAKAAWGRLAAKYPTLRSYSPSYAAVNVRGRNYVRLAANGVVDKRVGSALCQRVTGSASVCAQRQITNTQIRMANRAAPKPAAKAASRARQVASR